MKTRKCSKIKNRKSFKKNNRRSFRKNNRKSLINKTLKCTMMGGGVGEGEVFIQITPPPPSTADTAATAAADTAATAAAADTAAGGDICWHKIINTPVWESNDLTEKEKNIFINNFRYAKLIFEQNEKNEFETWLTNYVKKEKKKAEATIRSLRRKNQTLLNEINITTTMKMKDYATETKKRKIMELKENQDTLKIQTSLLKELYNRFNINDNVTETDVSSCNPKHKLGIFNMNKSNKKKKIREWINLWDTCCNLTPVFGTKFDELVSELDSEDRRGGVRYWIERRKKKLLPRVLLPQVGKRNEFGFIIPDTSLKDLTEPQYIQNLTENVYKLKGLNLSRYIISLGVLESPDYKMCSRKP